MQRWLHSHEEDTATERVYRPAAHPFPPSRGRTGFELRPDRTCTRIGIAARDGSSETGCTWSYADDGEPVATLSLEGGGSQVLRIVSVDADRLVVRK
jgi:hypothetical protein